MELNELEWIVLCLTVITLIGIALFYIGLEPRYIKGLKEFSGKNGFQEASSFWEDTDGIKYHSVKDNRVHLYYMRSAEISSDYFEVTEYEKMTPSAEYRSHWILIGITEGTTKSNANLMQKLASEFSWNSIERKQGGKINVYSQGGIVYAAIKPPMYTKSLAKRIEGMIQEVIAIR